MRRLLVAAVLVAASLIVVHWAAATTRTRFDLRGSVQLEESLDPFDCTAYGPVHATLRATTTRFYGTFVGLRPAADGPCAVRAIAGTWSGRIVHTRRGGGNVVDACIVNGHRAQTRIMYGTGSTLNVNCSWTGASGMTHELRLQLRRIR